MKPERGYDIDVTINGVKYTDDVNKVRIISNLTNAYQVVTISMLLDPNDIIRDRIFGKEPINMTIRYIGRGTTQAAVEEFKFELIHLSSANAMGGMSEINQNKVKELKQMNFITVPKKPFQTISYTVNDIYEGTTIKKIVQDMTSKAGAELVYDSDGENSDPIEQLIIPPTTLYNSILYLDNTFGLFDGASNLGFCQYDNKLYIMNLTKRLTKSQVFTIYQLSTDSKEVGKITEKCMDGQNFYSYADLVSTFSGNSTFAAKAMQVKHIFKPSDSLYRTFEQDMSEVCANYGVIAKNNEIDFESGLQNRESYHTTSTGNEGSDIVANARIARHIISLATVTVRLERNLPVMNLMKVGEPVKLVPQTVEYVDLSGKYLLKSSDIIFSRQARNWISDATIVLCRTNKTI